MAAVRYCGSRLVGRKDLLVEGEMSQEALSKPTTFGDALIEFENGTAFERRDPTEEQPR